MPIELAILINLLASTGLLAGLGWLLKKYIDKFVDAKFQQQSAKIEQQLQVAGEARKVLQGSFIEASKKIYAAVYSCRLAIRSMIEQESTDVADLENCWKQLENTLVENGLSVTRELFEAAHSSKRAAYTVLTSAKAFGNGRLDIEREEFWQRISEQMSILDRRYLELTNNTRAALDALDAKLSE